MRASRSRKLGLGGALLPQYDEHGQIEEWGKVGNYLEDVNPAFVKDGTVVEIEYQETTRDRKLRDPFIIQIRDDKVPSECRTEQVA